MDHTYIDMDAVQFPRMCRLLYSGLLVLGCSALDASPRRRCLLSQFSSRTQIK